MKLVGANVAESTVFVDDIAAVATVVVVAASVADAAAPKYPLEFHNSARCEISLTPPETPPLLLQREREREKLTDT